MKPSDRLINLIQQNRDQFSNEFVVWFPDNAHVWKAFVQETFAVIGVGFNHYSARTIVHVLRHHSAIQEHGSSWKINNNISPYLARLFELAYPQQAGIFHKRQTPRAEADTAITKNNMEIF
jgi:hypothetical protein